MWRGGHKTSRGPNWLAQRRFAYQRDGGICQVCQRNPKQGQRRNHVHHIKPFRQFDGENGYLLANDLSNLITLCASCHKKAEHGKLPVPVHLL